MAASPADEARPSERARALVQGAYDLHVHVGPDVPPRAMEVTLAVKGLGRFKRLFLVNQ